MKILRTYKIIAGWIVAIIILHEAFIGVFHSNPVYWINW